MIKVDLPSGKIGIAFRHPTVNVVLGSFVPEEGMTKVQVRKTFCEIYEIKGERDFKLLGEASIEWGSIKDRLARNRKNTRGIALTKALKAVGMKRTDREIVWNTYHDFLFMAKLEGAPAVCPKCGRSDVPVAADLPILEAELVGTANNAQRGAA